MREREKEREKEKVTFFPEEKRRTGRRGAEKISKNLPLKKQTTKEEEEEKEKEEEIREALLHYFGDQNIG